MYIAGRLRTASRPSSTAIDDESYFLSVVPAVGNPFSFLLPLLMSSISIEKIPLLYRFQSRPIPGQMPLFWSRVQRRSVHDLVHFCPLKEIFEMSSFRRCDESLRS